MAPEAVPQQVVVPPPRAAIFLTATVREGAEPAVLDLLSDLAGLRRSVRFRAPGDDLTCVAGIGSRLWDRLYDEPRPAGLHPFKELKGERHTAVATPGDLLFHLRAEHLDLCFELAQHIVRRLEGHADVVDEVHGFRYFDERDLLGFVDGTENPTGVRADEAVLVGQEDPDFAGGSYVIVQKYLHDMAAWDALTVEQQETVIGRHKLSDIEIPDEDKAPDSHLALNTVTGPDGGELKIVRENMPFGTIGSGEFGTYFIGYAARPEVTERMLRNMFLGDPPGSHDRILDFSTAVTGGLFFVPTEDFLEDPPQIRDTGAGDATGASGPTDATGVAGTSGATGATGATGG